VAYQGARGIDPNSIIALNLAFVTIPDLIFLLEVPLDEARNRIKLGRPEGFSTFEEREDLATVDRIYRSLKDPLIKRIDGSRSPERVHQSVLETFWSGPEKKRE
jgi:dTMP kinase